VGAMRESSIAVLAPISAVGSKDIRVRGIAADACRNYSPSETAGSRSSG
jgi:hypothetical protein